LDIMVVTDSDWGDGYCNQVTVTNTSMETVDWMITLDLEGTLNDGSPWNAMADARSGRVGFTGVEWNRRLDPAGSASFGLCATR
jgi:endoglucanase